MLKNKFLFIIILSFFSLFFSQKTSALVEEKSYQADFNINNNADDFSTRMPMFLPSVISLFYALLPLLAISALTMLILSYFIYKTNGSSAEVRIDVIWKVTRSLFALLIIAGMFTAKLFFKF
jgi:hypothetical protein